MHNFARKNLKKLNISNCNSNQEEKISIRFCDSKIPLTSDNNITIENSNYFKYVYYDTKSFLSLNYFFQVLVTERYIFPRK